MKTLTTLLAGALLSASACAQGVITRIGSDGTHFYYDGVDDLQTVFDDATTLSEGFKDTILFSGGAFQLTSALEVTSPVVVIGSGIRQDSSVVYGGSTRMNSGSVTMLLRDGADGSEFHGLTFNDEVRFGVDQADSNVDDVKFIRCSFHRLHLGTASGIQTLANGITIEECVILYDMYFDYSTDAEVRNSVIRNIHWAGPSSNIQVNNCIITNFDGSNSNENFNYLNCIFLRNAPSLHVTGNSSFTNCLFVGNGALFASNVTFASSILTEVESSYAPSLTAAFENVTSYTDYQANGNYATTPIYSAAPHLGTDDQPRGIYGGEAPWKNGSLPINPHWSQLSSPGNTAPNGILQEVRIKASAQEN